MKLNKLLKQLLLLFSFLTVIQLSYAKSSEREHVSVLALEVTNSSFEGAGTFDEILGQAKSSISDVIITFSVPIVEFLDNNPLANEKGNKITVDGIQPDGSKVSFVRPGGSTGYTCFSVLGSDYTIRNINFTDYRFGIRLRGDRNKVESCEFYDCVFGISVVGRDNRIGNKNLFIGDAMNSTGTGIIVAQGCKGLEIGETTNDYANYNFFGYLGTGITLLAGQANIQSCIIGGALPSVSFCDMPAPTNYSIVTGIYFDLRSTDVGECILGKRGQIFSNIISSCSSQFVYSFHSKNIEINNNAIGFDPRWCNGIPSNNAFLTQGIYIRESQDIRIGVNGGNTIDNAANGIEILSVGENICTDIEIRNNKIGLNDQETGSMKFGIRAGAERLNIIGNELGDCSSTGIHAARCTDTEVNDNFIAVSSSGNNRYTVGVGINFSGSKNVKSDNNYTSSYRLFNCTKVDITNNKLGSYVDGTSVGDLPIDAVSVEDNCTNINIGLPRRGNQFIGTYYNAISARQNSAAASFEDHYGVLHERPNVSIYSNYIPNVTNAGISINSLFEAKIGEKGNESSGNIILNGLYGIYSRIFFSGQTNKIEAYNNFIGIDRAGTTGAITSHGMILTDGPNISTGHIIGDAVTNSGNTITNCGGRGLSIGSIEQVKISGNSIFGNGVNIFLNHTSNRVDGVTVIMPEILSVRRSASNFELLISGSAASPLYDGGTVELFRKKAGVSGLYEYVGSGIVGTWFVLDKVLAQKNFEGYLATLTVNGRTSGISTLKTICHTEDPNNMDCLYFPDIPRFVKLEQGEINRYHFETSNDFLAIIWDDNTTDEMPAFKVFDYRRNEVTNISLESLDSGRYILDTSKLVALGTEDYQKVYSLELTDRKGIITKLRFKI